jgi:hypothetical protein
MRMRRCGKSKGKSEDASEEKTEDEDADEREKDAREHLTPPELRGWAWSWCG